MSRGPAGTERRPCAGCSSEVIAGRTSRGIDVQVETTEVDADGELLAAVAGIPTYMHHLGADTLGYRSPFQIRTAPAGTRARIAIRPEHRCLERNTRP